MAKSLEILEMLESIYNCIDQLVEECKITSDPGSQIFSAFNDGVYSMASRVKTELLVLKSGIRMKEMLNVGGED